jgi:hypothetical protein
MDELVTLRPGLPASWLALRDSLRVLVVVRDTRFRAAVDAALRALGVEVQHVDTTEPTLEDAFIALTERGLDPSSE